MDATRALALTRRWWWLLLIGAVMSLATYGILSRIRDRHPSPPVYAASGTLFVSLRSAATDAVQGPTQVVDRPFDMDRLLFTYSSLFGRSAVSERTVRDLALTNSADDVRRRLTVTQPKDTQLIQVTIRAAAPDEAERLVGGVVRAFMEIRREQSLPGDVALYETSPAALERDANSELLTIALVTLAGLVTAAGIILAFEYLSDAVRDAREAELATGLTALATIGTWRAGRGTAVSARGVSERIVDQYRLLRTNINLKTRDEHAQATVFASPRGSAGVTTTAMNYAAALAQTGRRVVLVDGDLRTGTIGARFASDVPHGLADALAMDLPVYGLVDATDIDGLSVITAGRPSESSTELLDSPRLEALLRELRERFDAIVIDGPAALDRADAALLASHCDAAVLVLRCDVTTRHDATAAAETLRRAVPRVLGVVLNADAGAASGGLRSLLPTWRRCGEAAEARA